MRIKLILLIVLAWARSLADEPPQDTVMIVEMTPGTVTSGEKVDVAIRVAYSLSSYEFAAIKLSANTLAPNGSQRIASAGIKKGTGEITLHAKIVPRYWSDVIPFGVSASLVVVLGDALIMKSLSVDRANFHILPSSEGNPGPWPKVSETYVDGLTILSISPEVFVEGVEQEIVVKANYELLSREEGEISLSVSEGSGATRWPIGGTRIKIGKGKTEIRAKFVPKKTGALPLARLLVALDEFPSGPTTMPLAWDEATIEVK